MNWQERAEKAEAELQRLQDQLKDPVSVHINMLRGLIAKPTWRQMVHISGIVPNTEEEQLSEIVRLREQLSETVQIQKQHSGGKHPSHTTRSSDSSLYDEKCINCGATDVAGGGWGKLAKPCEATIK